MQLDQLAVRLRLRNPWEAMDLGFSLVRAWLPRVYAPWLALFVPVCAAALALPPLWSCALVWWLKPVFDRVALHVLASGIFGSLPRPLDTLRALPNMMRPGLLLALTLFRFDFARSFNLPVWQLERQRGFAARRRARQLHRRTRSYAVWLTAACLSFQVVVLLSIMGLYDLLMPASGSQEFDFFTLFSQHQGQTWFGVLVAIAFFASIAAVEPFYVAAGFALYLNRRTALEGWDIEVELRQLGEQTQARLRAPVPAMVALLAAALMALLAATAPEPARAQDALASIEREEQAAREIKPILERPEFQTWKDQTVLQYLRQKEESKPRNVDSSLLVTLLASLAELVRLVAWIALASGLAYLAYYIGRRLQLWSPRAADSAPPDTLFGLDVRPQSLPSDPAAAALALAREGEPLLAMSLLYRAALVTLLHRDGVELSRGDTEEDCLRKSRPRISHDAASYFLRLLTAWQRMAYARRSVPGAEVDALCRDWNAHFGGARGAAA